MHKLITSSARKFWVDIQRDVPAGTDSWGEQTAAPAPPVRRKASVTTARGAERFQNAETVATSPVTFGFAFEEGLIKVTDRIVHRGRTYDVKSVEEVGYREGWLADAIARAEV